MSIYDRQREGRPQLSIAPEASIPDTASWDEDYGNVGMNDLNKPVPLHTGKFPKNGWTKELNLVTIVDGD